MNCSFPGWCTGKVCALCLVFSVLLQDRQGFEAQTDVPRKQRKEVEQSCR